MSHNSNSHNAVRDIILLKVQAEIIQLGIMYITKV